MSIYDYHNKSGLIEINLIDKVGFDQGIIRYKDLN